MGDLIPFLRKKKKSQRLDWLQGVTPRQEKTRPRPKWRIPPALPGALVILVMIAMLIWLF
jgi:hypothetical protein